MKRSERHRKPHMLGRMGIRVITKALVFALIIAFLPYASIVMRTIFSDTSKLAIKTSETLSHQLQEMARIETCVIDDEGIVAHQLNALLIGNVASLSIRYSYHASIGIDLRKVMLEVEENKIALLLPELEVLSDRIEPLEIQRNDFWYGYGIGDKQQQKMLSDEKEALTARYMADPIEREKMWQSTLTALETTMSTWLTGETAAQIVLVFVPPITSPVEVVP